MSKTLANLRVRTLKKLAPLLQDEGLIVVRPTARDSHGYKRTLVIENGKVFSVCDHRLIVRLEIGRWLTKSEIIHHMNGDKDDNRLENLLVVTPSQHGKLHGGKSVRRWQHPVGGMLPVPVQALCAHTRERRYG